jgi:hypothetical protein
MGERDLLAHKKLKTKFFGVEKFNMIGAAGASAGADDGVPIVAVQAGAGMLGVIQMGAAGDEVDLFEPIPYDLDRSQKVAGRIWFCHSSTDADTPDWVVKTKFHAKQATLVDFDTSEDVATAFAAAACSTTEESLEVTAWKDLSWDDYITATDIAFGLIIECNGLGSAGANEIEFIGFEIAYVPDECLLDGMADIDALINSNTLPLN